jgi:phosphoribulokinase
MIRPVHLHLPRRSPGRRPILLAIAGDSAAGKTTLARGIEEIIGPDRVTRISIDDYHRYDRRARAELGITPLHPDCNYLDIVEQHLTHLALGQPILKPVYDHSEGVFRPPVYVQPREFVVVEGLLPLLTPTMRSCFDVKVYLDPDEGLRRQWKIRRDTLARGYTPEQVLAELERREPDAEQYVRPQRVHADIVVRFHPPATQGRDPQGDGTDGRRLGARLVLRPTLTHPNLEALLTLLDGRGRPPLRLTLERDLGRPAEVLEIDGDCPATAGRILEDALWHRLHPDDRLRRERIGRFVAADGREERSESLALAQLLVVYQLVAATRPDSMVALA